MDLKRAIALYKRAIDEVDNTDAMFCLAELFLKGTGASDDAVRATQLLQRAIDKDGRADALICLAGVLKRGAIGVPSDPLRAVELYTRAIEEHGSGHAIVRLVGFWKAVQKVYLSIRNVLSVCTIVRCRRQSTKSLQKD